MPTTCRRCHRTLRKSRDIGPTCARREAAEHSYRPAQVEKAHEVLDDHGIAATPIRTARGRRVFVVVSSDGSDRYFATVAACTCASGLHRGGRGGSLCYHTLAARLAC